VKIITVPNQHLRRKAKPIEKVDKKLLKFLKQFNETLSKQDSPKGIGLAAPQVDKSWRIFATQLSNRDRTDYQPLRLFINPEIIAHSKKTSFGPDEKKPDLEGCLSIPALYGPVPRWEWIELAYQIIENDISDPEFCSQNSVGMKDTAYKLVNKKEKFEDFNARVIQHERDHLDGILFTDYILEHDLPVYKVNEETDKLEEVKDRNILEIF